MAGPEGVLAEARVVTDGRALPLAPARGRGAAGGPRASPRAPSTPSPSPSDRAPSPGCGWAWGACRAWPSRAGAPASACSTLDVLAARGRGLLGDDRGAHRRLPGRGLLGGLRRGRRLCAASDGWGRSPRCSTGCPRGRRSSGDAALEHRDAIRGRRPGRRLPGLARVPRGAPRRSPPCGSPPPAPRCPPPALRPLYLRGAGVRPPRREPRRPPAAGAARGRARARGARGGLLHPSLDARRRSRRRSPAARPDVVLVLEGPRPRAGRPAGYAPTAPSASSSTRCT